MKVSVVSAFVPLEVKHLSPDEYHAYGNRLRSVCGDRLHVFEHPLNECWAYGFHDMPPAAATPGDRYASAQAHVASNIVQHNRTSWALRLQKTNPSDVVVWFDYAILKQGAWRNNPVTEDHVRDFLQKLERMDVLEDIPFPGIEPMKVVDPHGNNWRFCGSTHIWPTQFLPQIHQEYRHELYQFVHRYRAVPLDLAIWPAVEFNSGLPFRWYKAEYDATQLTNLP